LGKSGGGNPTLKQLILGIDPGSRITGYGLVEANRDLVRHVDHGAIRLPEGRGLAERLLALQLALAEIYSRHAVGHTVVEKIFFGKNADSAFKLGHARGVCLLVAAQFGSRLSEYAARYVKKCVTGSGAAGKESVQMMVFNQLRLPQAKCVTDASDALALALTHARIHETNNRIHRAFSERSP